MVAAPAMLPATETAPEAAPEAVAVAVPTRLVTAALRRYQITRRRIVRLGLGRLEAKRRPSRPAPSGSFGGNGFNDALEQIAGAPGREDQLGVGWIILQFGAQP